MKHLLIYYRHHHHHQIIISSSLSSLSLFIFVNTIDVFHWLAWLSSCEKQMAISIKLKKIETKVLVKRSNRLDPEDTRFCTKKNPIKALKLWHYTNMGGWGLAAVSRWLDLLPAPVHQKEEDLNGLYLFLSFLDLQSSISIQGTCLLSVC